jgi:hypothetical protein
MATYTIAGSGTGTDILTGHFYQNAAGALSTSVLFIAPVACVLTGIEYSWGTAAGATSTWDLTKDPSLTAAGAGTSVLASTINANTTADTSAAASLTATGATLAFAVGDKLSIKVATGAATGSAKVIVTAYFKKS